MPQGAGFEGWEHVYAQEPFLCEKASTAGVSTQAISQLLVIDRPCLTDCLCLQCGTHGADVSITDPAERERVIGGEVTVWSERLDPAIMLVTTQTSDSVGAL